MGISGYVVASLQCIGARIVKVRKIMLVDWTYVLPCISCTWH
jgi:hypothetical protein